MPRPAAVRSAPRTVERNLSSSSTRGDRTRGRNHQERCGDTGAQLGAPSKADTGPEPRRLRPSAYPLQRTMDGEAQPGILCVTFK
jgi:hypothetical protein